MYNNNNNFQERLIYILRPQIKIKKKWKIMITIVNSLLSTYFFRALVDEDSNFKQ